jgi:putative transposase
LNFHGTVRIPVNGEDHFFPIHRLNFLPLLDHFSRCVLGYHVAVGKEASASDVLHAVRNALDVWKPRPLPPGLTYPVNAALPSGVIPESRGQCWSLFLLDNASIHYSKIVADRIPQSIGCTVCWGAYGDWFQRPEIESLFSSFSRRGFLSLPNSTGTDSQDPRRNDSVKNAVDLEITWEELLDLIDVSVCTYNGTVRGEFGNRSPLQRLSDAFSRASTFWLPRIQPLRPPSVPDLEVIFVVELPVRGNIGEGRRPYVQYKNVRYTSPVLANLPQLIGKTIIAHIRDDLRQFRVFLKDGAELGILRAMGGWAISQHDHALRKEIFKAIRKDDLIVSSGDNPVMEYIHFKARKAVRGTKDGKRPIILPEATQLARAIQVSQESVPEVNNTWRPAKGEPVREAPMAPNPSYVPSIKHKGFIT